jgi:glucokinase
MGYRAFAGEVEKVRGGADIGGVGFGLPSQIDQRHGRVLDSTNIPLEDLDFAGEMRRRLGADVMIDNDANAACLAEWRIGAAKGADNVVMLTLGTGVGGGLILDGRPYRGSTGAGAEFEARSDQRGLDGGAAEVDADDRQRGGIGHGGG